MGKPRLPQRGLTAKNVGEPAGMQRQCSMAGSSSVERCPPVQETYRRGGRSRVEPGVGVARVKSALFGALGSLPQGEMAIAADAAKSHAPMCCL
jgi:hypothetical protein